MGIFLAWLVGGIILGLLCQGLVGMPILYGLFISALVCVPIVIISGLLGGLTVKSESRGARATRDHNGDLAWGESASDKNWLGDFLFVLLFIVAFPFILVLDLAKKS